MDVHILFPQPTPTSDHCSLTIINPVLRFLPFQMFFIKETNIVWKHIKKYKKNTSPSVIE